MNNIYKAPEIEIILLDAQDIVTTSPGTESPWEDLGFGSDW